MANEITYEDMKRLYSENKDLKNYVDKYATTRKLTVDEALKCKMTRLAAVYYLGDTLYSVEN